MRDKNWFKSIFSKNNFPIDEQKLSLLDKYCHLLIQKNQHVNLISPKSEKNIWEDHILHSLSFLLKVKLFPKSNILDLGTGGGLPGIPLKILFPDFNLVLLDSTQKKIIAVNDIISSLDLKNIVTLTGRAEELKSNENLKNKFDYVISRAVGQLDKLLEWGLPFLKKTTQENNSTISRGTILALKGGNIDEELKLVKKNKKIDHYEIFDISFIGSDELFNPDKKLIVLYPKII